MFDYLLGVFNTLFTTPEIKQVIVQKAHSEKQYRPSWSAEEVAILMGNLDTPVEDLLKLLPDRTEAALYHKRRKLTK